MNTPSVALTNGERALLAHIDFVPAVYYQHPALSRLFQLGYVQADFHPWDGCFCAEVSITRQGAAVSRRLN